MAGPDGIELGRSTSTSGGAVGNGTAAAAAEATRAAAPSSSSSYWAKDSQGEDVIYMSEEHMR